MESRSDGLRLPPPWVSSAAGKPDREVQKVIYLQRRRVASPYTINDADALTWANNVASSDGVQLPDAIKQALDTYVQTIKTTGLGGAAGSIWSQAAQLLLPCGPLTLAGALRPLKGAAPTNANFTSGDYNRKNGLGDAANSSKYLDSNVAMNAIPASSNGLFAYGNITTTTGDRATVGWYGGGTGNDLFSLDEWANYSPPGRAFRSGGSGNGLFPLSPSTASATCMIGSRTALNSAVLYIDETTTANTTTVSPSFSSTQRLYYYGLNINNSFAASTASRSVLQANGIFSTGLNAAQAAALRTATAAYVAAVSAAIP